MVIHRLSTDWLIGYVLYVQFSSFGHIETRPCLKVLSVGLDDPWIEYCCRLSHSYTKAAKTAVDPVYERLLF